MELNTVPSSLQMITPYHSDRLYESTHQNLLGNFKNPSTQASLQPSDLICPESGSQAAVFSLKISKGFQCAATAEQQRSVRSHSDLREQRSLATLLALLSLLSFLFDPGLQQSSYLHWF